MRRIREAGRDVDEVLEAAGLSRRPERDRRREDSCDLAFGIAALAAVALPAIAMALAGL